LTRTPRISNEAPPQTDEVYFGDGTALRIIRKRWLRSTVGICKQFPPMI
jgi:hypothetical protein